MTNSLTRVSQRVVLVVVELVVVLEGEAVVRVYLSITWQFFY